MDIEHDDLFYYTNRDDTRLIEKFNEILKEIDDKYKDSFRHMSLKTAAELKKKYNKTFN